MIFSDIFPTKFHLTEVFCLACFISRILNAKIDIDFCISCMNHSFINMFFLLFIPTFHAIFVICVFLIYNPLALITFFFLFFFCNKKLVNFPFEPLSIHLFVIYCSVLLPVQFNLLQNSYSPSFMINHYQCLLDDSFYYPSHCFFSLIFSPFFLLIYSPLSTAFLFFSKFNFFSDYIFSPGCLAVGLDSLTFRLGMKIDYS